MKVLIVKTSSMGDVIHTFPALEDASRARPDITFDWCVEDAFAGIAALHPAVRNIHTVAVRRWRRNWGNASTWREARQLRQALLREEYDLVIDAQGLVKSAVVAKLANAPISGFDRASVRESSAAFFYKRSYNVARDLHAIERTRRLFGLALGYEPDLSKLESGLTLPGTVDSAAAFLLHGTSREDKKWPVEDWIDTARLLVEAGMKPVTTWSNQRERSVAEAIKKAVPDTALVEKSPLVEVAAKIGKSSLVIGADTGLMHLASAYGLPTVAIFLTTQPGLTGPRGPFSSTLLADQGGRVTPGEVINEAKRLMATRKAAQQELR